MSKLDIEIPLLPEDISIPEEWLSLVEGKNNEFPEKTQEMNSDKVKNSLILPKVQSSGSIPNMVNHTLGFRNGTEDSNTYKNFITYGIHSKISILHEEKFILRNVSSKKHFKNRILCYFKEPGIIPFYCILCRKESFINFNSNNTVSVFCGHFIACNECRGRSVRRILRCKKCCEDISGIFPVCIKDECIDNHDKFPVNAGNCPLCETRVRKEECNYNCRRRQTSDYYTSRKSISEKVIELVQNPDVIEKKGFFRPCPHFSYCPIHNVICKGHGKISACSYCKDQKHTGVIHYKVR